eukprot:GHVR01182982.1.p2 GENE.GHVR01182982.1~~GHVR01182982.1.p2  ORF type:complete len:134 (+),score=9.07 GHVR01182982.1:1109-1510(+)
MASSGTANEGIDAVIAERVYISGGDLILIVYTNAADSLESDSVRADLVSVSQANGYAPITLDGTWSSTDGIVTYTHSTPTNPTWTATGTWSATVTGVAIIDNPTSSLLHWKDLDTPFVAAANRKLAIDIATII